MTQSELEAKRLATAQKVLDLLDRELGEDSLEEGMKVLDLAIGARYVVRDLNRLSLIAQIRS